MTELGEEKKKSEGTISHSRVDKRLKISERLDDRIRKKVVAKKKKN